jgi:biotin-dependent carboxylase-like uncharacterized protein
MGPEILSIIAPGLGAAIQDLGCLGGRRFGVPPGGAMDDHAATFANRVLDNPPEAPTLELLLQGARLTVLEETWIALAGADADSNLPMWRAVHVHPGQTIAFPRHRSGVWIYLSVEGGFEATISGEPGLGFSRGLIGKRLSKGDRLRRRCSFSFHLPSRVAGRVVAWDEQRDYENPPDLRLWPGPQWDRFSREDCQALLEADWSVTSQSNRIGYRLEGPPLTSFPGQILSEPVRAGSVQVPPNGQPIVTMRDGPTVGGYPKIGLVDPRDLDWLAQCRPGQTVRFVPVE